MIAKVIAGVESGFYQYAMRFEEKLYLKYTKNTAPLEMAVQKIKNIHFCSRNTAIMIACTSWGLYQILGMNIYSVCNISKHIVEFLQDVDLQEKAFINFCQARKISITKTEEELKQVASVFQNIKTESKNYAEALEKFSQHLMDKKTLYPNLITFIRRYNGASFGSDAFLDYLLRMLHYYNEIKKEEVIG